MLEIGKLIEVRLIKHALVVDKKISEYLKNIQYEAMQSPTEKYLQEIPRGGSKRSLTGQNLLQWPPHKQTNYEYDMHLR